MPVPWLSLSGRPPGRRWVDLVYGNAERRGRNDDHERQQVHNESSPVSAGLPRFGRAAARHVAALALRHRRSGAGRAGVGRPTPRGGSNVVAGAAAGPDGVRQLTVSVALVLRRQRPPDQPGPPHRGWTLAPGRLGGAILLGEFHRL